MSTWTAKAHELREAQARVLADILRDLDPDDPVLDPFKTRHQIGSRSPAGDEQRLRMIPVYARGVPGTIPETDPLRALLARQPAD